MIDHHNISSDNTADLLRSFSEPLQEKPEFNSDLHVALENLNNADSGIEVTEGSMNNAHVEFQTFLRLVYSQNH